MPSAITCKNCGNHFTGNFCNACGEKVYSDKDKKIAHIVEEGFHFITHFEGKFFTTLKTIFISPGKLSANYCDGIRKKYFKPLSFFLMLVILYLIFPVFEGLNMKLRFYESHHLFGNYATDKVAAVLEQKNITHEALAPLFHKAGEKASKFLLFIIIPLIALVSLLLGYRKRRLYYDHFVFAIEMSSFFLLWGFLLLPLLIVIVNFFTSSTVFKSEGQTGLTILAVFMLYVAIAANRFFAFKWWYTILYTLLFTLSFVLFLEYIYKFILFNIAIKLV